MAARSACSEISTERGLTDEYTNRVAHRVRLRRRAPSGPHLDGSTRRLRSDTSEDIHLIVQDPDGNEFGL